MVLMPENTKPPMVALVETLRQRYRYFKNHAGDRLTKAMFLAQRRTIANDVRIPSEERRDFLAALDQVQEELFPTGENDGDDA